MAYKDELENFISSFGVPKEVVKAELFLLGFDDLKIQDEGELLIDCSGRRVGIYAKLYLLCEPPKLTENKGEVIMIPFRKLVGCEQNMFYHRNPTYPTPAEIIRRYVNSYNEDIAFVDTLGNIFFVDIIHNGNKDVAPLFYKIVYENAHPIIDVLPDTIYRRLYEFERGNLQLQINAVRNAILEMKKVFEKKYEEQNKLIKNIKMRGIEQGMFIMSEFLIGSNDFKVQQEGSLVFLVYKKRIKCDTVKKERKLYRIPENMTKPYIDGLAIEIGTTINQVICHRAFHPNVNINNDVCIGEMKNMPFTKENIKTLITSLRTCNLDSAHDNKAKRYLLDLYYKNQLTEEEDYVYS